MQTHQSTNSTVNTFGLALISTFAVVAAFLDFIILRVVVLLSRFRSTLAPRIDEWIQDSALQMHRQVHEASAGSKWEEFDDDILGSPNTEKLGGLPHYSEVTLAEVRKGGISQLKGMLD